MAQWDRKRSDRGLGVAYIDYSGTQIAGVAEVSIDHKTAKFAFTISGARSSGHRCAAR